jgi:hypothetical protein
MIPLRSIVLIFDLVFDWILAPMSHEADLGAVVIGGVIGGDDEVLMGIRNLVEENCCWALRSRFVRLLWLAFCAPSLLWEQRLVLVCGFGGLGGGFGRRSR